MQWFSSCLDCCPHLTQRGSTASSSGLLLESAVGTAVQDFLLPAEMRTDGFWSAYLNHMEYDLRHLRPHHHQQIRGLRHIIMERWSLLHVCGGF